MDQIFNHYGKIIGAVLGIIIVIAIIYAVSTGINSDSVSITQDLKGYVSEQMSANSFNGGNGGN